MRVIPVFNYFGTKLRLSQRGFYPPPRHLPVVEPFAGGAGYSIAMRAPLVVLIESNPWVAGAWKYLIKATQAEILSLPNIAPGQHIKDLAICEEARTLIGLNCGASVTSRQGKLTPWALTGNPSLYWGAARKQALASMLPLFKGWSVYEDEYYNADKYVSGPATWFVDPPYYRSGKQYAKHSKDRSWYDQLGAWCKTRDGLTIVCEQSGATWLPFVYVTTYNRGKYRGRPRRDGSPSAFGPATADEVVWISA